MDKVSLLQKKNYEFHITVGTNSRILYPLKYILDTVVGPNLVSKYFLKPELTAFVKPIEYPGLRAATKNSVKIDGMVLLNIQIGDLTTSA